MDLRTVWDAEGKGSCAPQGGPEEIHSEHHLLADAVRVIQPGRKVDGDIEGTRLGTLQSSAGFVDGIVRADSDFSP